MSAGRSIATDLPMPSGTKREVASLAATLTTAASVDAKPGHYAVRLTLHSSLDPAALDGAGL